MLDPRGAAQLDLGDRVVGHDRGGALGFDWAFRNCDRIEGIAYMETIARPRRFGEESDHGQRMFSALRSSSGE